MSQLTRRKIARRVAAVCLFVFVAIQFDRPDRSSPEVTLANDFIQSTQPPAEIEQVLRSACYDCHSHETVWPWYSNVAPVSWWISEHVRHGRQRLNFSEWGDAAADQQRQKLNACVEYVKDGRMPLESYIVGHAEAELSPEQRARLCDWFKKVSGTF